MSAPTYAPWVPAGRSARAASTWCRSWRTAGPAATTRGPRTPCRTTAPPRRRRRHRQRARSARPPLPGAWTACRATACSPPLPRRRRRRRATSCRPPPCCSSTGPPRRGTASRRPTTPRRPRTGRRRSRSPRRRTARTRTAQQAPAASCIAPVCSYRLRIPHGLLDAWAASSYLQRPAWCIYQGENWTVARGQCAGRR